MAKLLLHESPPSPKLKKIVTGKKSWKSVKHDNERERKEILELIIVTLSEVLRKKPDKKQK